MQRYAIGALILQALLAPAAPAELARFGLPAKPTVVSVGFVLLDLNAINEQEETFEFEALVTLRWQDPRQAFDPAETGVHEKYYEGDFHFTESYVGWWPQLGIENSAGRFDQQGRLLRIQPDGSMSYVYQLHATAERPLYLRAFPFDRQQLAVYMQVMGHGADEVLLRTDPEETGTASRFINIAGWTLKGVSTHAELSEVHHRLRASQLVTRLDVEREPFHVIVLVVVPLTLLVMLTWSVFWMDEESLSDRINISFIGILSVVAYQFIVQDTMPAIGYFTLLDAFLISTLVIVGLGVVVSLVVDNLNRRNQQRLGDRVDYACRWGFPLLFVSVNTVCVLMLT